MRTIIALAAIMLLGASDTVRASNPADLTFFHRRTSVSCVKVNLDDGPWAITWAGPINAGASFTLYHWQSEDGEVRQDQLMLAHSLSRSLDLTVVGELWHGRNFDSRAELGLDLHKGRFGLGLVLPARAEEQIKIGPRIAIGEFRTFLTASEGAKPLYGVSTTQRGINLEYAVGSGTHFVRSSKLCGEILPELRLRFSSKENFFGFGIGFLSR